MEIYNGKIEILTFVILSIADRNLIIGVKFDLNVKKMRQMTSAVSDDSFISSIWGYINGIHITMFGVLIVIASSVYMKLRLKTLASVMLSSFVRFCINSVSYG